MRPDLFRSACAALALVFLAGCTSSASPDAAPKASTSDMVVTPSYPPSSPSSSSPRPSVSPSSPATALPLAFSTGSATEVITVTAASTSSTTGTLRAWQKLDGRWHEYGSAVFAYLGSDGLTTHPSEGRSATPIGSFTLTQAFGQQPDPGTSLPYHQTNPADWWISQYPSAVYNTMQVCAGTCPFAHAPNEHLVTTVPEYRYAVVVDYNTRNSPTGVRQGAGSAFFLHVQHGQPTVGCVAIDQTRLVALLRWLTPSAHPRILIGVA